MYNVGNLISKTTEVSLRENDLSISPFLEKKHFQVHMQKLTTFSTRYWGLLNFHLFNSY